QASPAWARASLAQGPIPSAASRTSPWAGPGNSQIGCQLNSIQFDATAWAPAPPSPQLVSPATDFCADARERVDTRTRWVVRTTEAVRPDGSAWPPAPRPPGC